MHVDGRRQHLYLWYDMGDFRWFSRKFPELLQDTSEDLQLPSQNTPGGLVTESDGAGGLTFTAHTSDRDALAPADRAAAAAAAVEMTSLLLEARIVPN